MARPARLYLEGMRHRLIFEILKVIFYQFYEGIEESYLKHNETVKDKVPADRLLIWNVKDGWEPLCKFLEKPIPDIPVPHNNKTGDTGWIENMVLESKFWSSTMSALKWNMAKFVFGLIVIIALGLGLGLGLA